MMPALSGWVSVGDLTKKLGFAWGEAMGAEDLFCVLQ